MTKRAELAAEELARRGWDLSENSDTFCTVCRRVHKHTDNYCPACGTKRGTSANSSALDDIEAAIAAAVGAGS